MAKEKNMYWTCYAWIVCAETPLILLLTFFFPPNSSIPCYTAKVSSTLYSIPSEMHSVNFSFYYIQW
jgi:hypothetical protein